MDCNEASCHGTPNEMAVEKGELLAVVTLPRLDKILPNCVGHSMCSNIFRKFNIKKQLRAKTEMRRETFRV